MEHKIYLSIGTNLGDREFHLREAVQALTPKVSVLNESLIYETIPWGFRDQPDFLNQVIAAKTKLSPHELLAYLKNIEVQIGRKPNFLNGPRVVDLDILFYDDYIFDDDHLIIPHPHLHQRAFVLVPLVEIAPKLLHPIYGSTVKELLDSLGSEGVEPFLKSEIDT